MLGKYFGRDIVNTGRQREMDMAKGFAIIFMVWVHVFEELSPQSVGGLNTFVEVMGGPFAAPIFMICMGIGVEYSRRNTSAALLHRGISLLCIGLLLNVFRYFIPDLVKYALTKDNTWLSATFSLFSVDILQFAGLAFLFLALVKKLQIKNIPLLCIGFTASMLGTVLRGVSTGNYVVDQFLGFIWGTDTLPFCSTGAWLQVWPGQVVYLP